MTVSLEEDLICGGCGYSLRGISSARCPECGRRFDPSHLIGDLIPWEQRRWIGRIPAYVRTVWLASFAPGQIAHAARWPVSLPDARAFRRVTWFFAALSLGGSIALWHRLWNPPAPTPFQLNHELIWLVLLHPISLAVSMIVLITWLWAAMATSEAMSAPRHLTIQERWRSRALNCYSCGALAWSLLIPPILLVYWTQPPARDWSVNTTDLTLPAILLLAEVLTWRWWWRQCRWPFRVFAVIGNLLAIAIVFAVALSNWEPSNTPAIKLPVILAGFLAVAWWLSSFRLLRLTTRRTRARQVLMGLALPLIWIGLALLVFAAVESAYLVVQVALAM